MIFEKEKQKRYVSKEVSQKTSFYSVSMRICSYIFLSPLDLAT